MTAVLGFLFTAIALGLSRQVPVWVPFALFGGLVLGSNEFGWIVTVLGTAIQIVATAVVAGPCCASLTNRVFRGATGGQLESEPRAPSATTRGALVFTSSATLCRCRTILINSPRPPG